MRWIKYTKTQNSNSKKENKMNISIYINDEEIAIKDNQEDENPW